jgi:uncharacterized protein YrrD
MQERRILNVEKELKGMPVLRVDTGSKLGEVSDTIIHPVKGEILGIVVRSIEASEQILLTSSFFIGVDAIMADGKADYEDIPSDNPGRGVTALGRLVNTNLVTEAGRLVGRISEVYVSTQKPFVIYHIVESTLQKFFGGGFFVPGDIARAYSSDGVRMIVPVDIEDRFATSSIEDAMDIREQAFAQKPAGA